MQDTKVGVLGAGTMGKQLALLCYSDGVFVHIQTNKSDRF